MPIQRNVIIKYAFIRIHNLLLLKVIKLKVDINITLFFFVFFLFFLMLLYHFILMNNVIEPVGLITSIQVFHMHMSNF